MTTRADQIEAAARALLDAYRDYIPGEVRLRAHDELRAALALPPDPPLARETAMRIAEAVAEAVENDAALTSEHTERLAAIVDRILGPASEVERAEREVVEAAVRAQEAMRASEAEPTRTMLMDAYLRAGHERVRAIDRLHAARERAGR